MTEQTEQDVQNLILDYLNRQSDFFAWRNNNHAVYDPVKKVFRKKVGFDIKGVSDILGIYMPHGVFIAIEAKEPAATFASVTPEQRSFITKINHMGGAATWCNSLRMGMDFVRDVRERYEY